MRFIRLAAIAVAAMAFAASSFAQGCPTTGPALVAPANGATNLQPAVTFQWTTIPNATLYRIFISNPVVANGDFQQIATSTDTDQTAVVPAGSISWYVEADVPNCSPARSPMSSFTVAQPACGIGTIALTAPTNGTTTTSPVKFSWNAVSNAVAYRVWVGEDTIAPTIIGRTTNPSASFSIPSGAIDWYVEALFNDCPSIFSPHGRFNVSRSPVCGSQATTLVAPVGGATVTSPITVDWTDVPGAVGYHVWIGSAGQFVDEGFTSASQLKLSLAPGTYTWYVDTIDSGCPPVPSAPTTFTIPEPAVSCSGQAPSITGPGPGSSNASPVTFSWTSVPNVKQYRVYGSLSGGDVQLLGTTNRTTLQLSVPPGTITWIVEATFQGCAATRSAPSRFTVPRSNVCPATKPQLLTPADGANNVTSPATFSWTSVSAAVRYIVVAKGQNGAATVIGDTTATQLQRDVPAGTVQWYVVSLGSGCDPLASAKSTFTVPQPPGCPTRRPHPLAPADDAVNAASPVHFEWTKTPGAKEYKLFAAVDRNEPSQVATATTNSVTVPMPSGAIRWYVEAVTDSCPALFSALNDVTVASQSGTCATPDRPQAHVIAQALSGTGYSVRWTGVSNAGSYQLQESTSLTFANATTQTVSGVSATFNHAATTAPVVYFYRVRAMSSCSDERSAFSKIAATRVVPPNAINTKSRATAEVGVSSPIVQTLTIPGSSTPLAFSAATDRPWMRVEPTTGTIGPNGTTLTITSDPTTLNVGSNQGAVIISTPTAERRIESNGPTPSTVPVSVSLVTPVAPDTTDSPSPDSLIIPAVVHGPGANNSLFQSDIRLANVSSQAQKYMINFTPTGTDGTQTGTIATIQVDPGSSAALDDLLSSFFGTASDGSAAGMLEIRPLTTSSSSLLSSVPAGALSTVASSRTYNVTSLGTFGQFIPAVPFSQFVGQGTVLSLQQISQSADNTKGYRTNFGLVEASGEPAQVILHVFDDAGTHIADIAESLLPSEHLPLNGLLTLNHIALSDGRVEVEVVSSTGKVTAYASVIDNGTNDPLLVSPVVKDAATTTRSVIPGVAYSNGIANWRSDVRLFNAGTSKVDATLSYYPQGSPGSPVIRSATINAGQVLPLDNVLNATFGINDLNAGGSLVVSTPSAAPLIATARTYAATTNGTIGQFIPAVTPDNSIGAGDRSLQIIQLESSASFRTNIGIAETTGNPVTVEIALNQSDTKITPVIEWTLQPNEFIQLSLDQFGVPRPIYNARISVTVTGGSGKVTAYGSLIDYASSDPTYVPAQ
ncbi:MAG TPA: hypothetical protein VLU46_16010 [Thermoanaerobaculia bacterium]|nr:hypothetical protein [Thermoanaerobaculia bacterium]